MKRRLLRIVSDMPRLNGVCTDRFEVSNQYIGTTESVWETLTLFFQSRNADIVLLNSNTHRLLILCLLRWLIPLYRARLVVVDVHLSQPTTSMDQLVARLKRRLLRKVDHFVHYFRDFSSYDRYYGLGSRSSFVPFKVNYIETIPTGEKFSSDGEYVFTAGKSFRDLPTFIEAMRRVPYPGLFLYEGDSVMKAFGAGLAWGQLPDNLVAERHDGQESWINYIRKAKLVVVPILPNALYAPGLSLYPMAMALNKCVVVTEGGSTRGLLTAEEAIIVPPENPVALAEAIRRAWEDDNLRERLAAAGKRYAKKLGGEARLLADLADVCGGLLSEKEVQERSNVAIGSI